VSSARRPWRRTSVTASTAATGAVGLWTRPLGTSAKRAPGGGGGGGPPPPPRAEANRGRPTHVRIPATVLAVIVVASGAVGFGIGSSSGGATTPSAKTTATAAAKTSGTSSTTTSSATGKNYSKQEKSDSSVVSEP